MHADAYIGIFLNVDGFVVGSVDNVCGVFEGLSATHGVVIDYDVTSQTARVAEGVRLKVVRVLRLSWLGQVRGTAHTVQLLYHLSHLIGTIITHY